MRSDEMRAKATECCAKAAGADALIAFYYRHAAQCWNDMADQMEWLEHEPVYRRIQNRKD